MSIEPQPASQALEPNPKDSPLREGLQELADSYTRMRGMVHPEDLSGGLADFMRHALSTDASAHRELKGAVFSLAAAEQKQRNYGQVKQGATEMIGRIKHANGLFSGPLERTGADPAGNARIFKKWTADVAPATEGYSGLLHQKSRAEDDFNLTADKIFDPDDPTATTDVSTMFDDDTYPMVAEQIRQAVENPEDQPVEELTRKVNEAELSPIAADHRLKLAGDFADDVHSRSVAMDTRLVADTNRHIASLEQEFSRPEAP